MSQAAPHRSPSFEVTRNVRLFYVLGFLRELSPLLVIWVVYLTDYRHLTLAQVGLMEGLFWLIKLGAEIPSGAFADRYGRRLTFVTGLVLEASGVVVFALAAGFGLLMVSYGIWAADGSTRGFVMAIPEPASLVLLALGGLIAARRSR